MESSEKEAFKETTLIISTGAPETGLGINPDTRTGSVLNQPIQSFLTAIEERNVSLGELLNGFVNQLLQSPDAYDSGPFHIRSVGDHFGLEHLNGLAIEAGAGHVIQSEHRFWRLLRDHTVHLFRYRLQQGNIAVGVINEQDPLAPMLNELHSTRKRNIANLWNRAGCCGHANYFYPVRPAGKDDKSKAAAIVDFCA